MKVEELILEMSKDEFEKKLREDEIFFNYISKKIEEGVSVIVLNDDVLRNVDLEAWSVDPCLISYLREIGEEIPDFEDEEEEEAFWWDVLWDAIEYYKEKDGRRGYVWIPPSISGESFGMVLWYD